VSALAAEILAAEPGPHLLAEVAGAAGNPLFVAELLETIRQDGLLRAADGRAEVTTISLPPTLGLTILRRLSFLSEDTLQALRCAAILGSGFSLTDLSNPQIGERLYISRRTVQTHVAHIFMKLGVSSRAQIAAEVIRQPGRG
jgi:DNA-binding CsgD family transcriptional regulator